jgi:hypothetical protein
LLCWDDRIRDIANGTVSTVAIGHHRSNE